MTYLLNDKHLENALQMAGPERYEYLVKRAADWGALYSLQSAFGWAVAEDKQGSRLLPVWPHERFAELCTTGDWSDCTTVEIPLKEWFAEVSKTAIAESMKIAVFRLPEGHGVIVDPERLSNDLREQLSKIEEA